MKATLGCILSLALVGSAGAQNSADAGAQGTANPQGGSGSQQSSGSRPDRAAHGAAPEARRPQPKSRANSKSDQQKFHARLDPSTGAAAGSSGSAAPSGTADFSSDGDVVVYHVRVLGMTTPVTTAEIHEGADDGPVIVAIPLTPDVTEGTAQAEGQIQASQIQGKKPDGSPMTMDDLVDAMRSGRTYVNVPTQNAKHGGLGGPIQSQGP